MGKKNNKEPRKENEDNNPTTREEPQRMIVEETMEDKEERVMKEMRERCLAIQRTRDIEEKQRMAEDVLRQQAIQRDQENTVPQQIQRDQDSNPQQIQRHQDANPPQIQRDQDSNPQQIQRDQDANPQQIQRDQEANPQQIQRHQDANPQQIQRHQDANPQQIQRHQEANPQQIQRHQDANPQQIQRHQDANPQQIQRHQDAVPQQTVPQVLPRVCARHSSSGGCSDDDCRKLHLCRQFLTGVCSLGADCRYGHSLATAHNRGPSSTEANTSAAEEVEMLAMALTLSLMEAKQGEMGAEAASASSQQNAARKEQLYGELQCPICLELFNMATTLGCGHTFCSGCLQGARASGQTSCPLCRAPVTSATRSVTLDNIVRNMASGD